MVDTGAVVQIVDIQGAQCVLDLVGDAGCGDGVHEVGGVALGLRAEVGVGGEQAAEDLGRLPGPKVVQGAMGRAGLARMVHAGGHLAACSSVGRGRGAWARAPNGSGPSPTAVTGLRAPRPDRSSDSATGHR